MSRADEATREILRHTYRNDTLSDDEKAGAALPTSESNRFASSAPQTLTERFGDAVASGIRRR